MNERGSMSALGQKQTSECLCAMSALSPKADIDSPAYEDTLSFVDSGRSLIADPVGVTDNTSGVAPRAGAGLAPVERTGHRTIA